MGPFPGFATFSETKIHKHIAEGGAGTDDDRLHQVRMIGHPYIIRGDVIVDKKSDRRYTAEIVNNLLELRRVPVIQAIDVSEINRDSVVHQLGFE
jgi:hypothetical protein